MGSISAAKLVSRRIHNIPGKLKVGELFFDVPVDHSKPDGGTIRLFARSVERLEIPVDPDKKEKKQLPWMLYLQGGPGLPCRPPQDYGWTGLIVDKGYQMLYLDQRGVGLSTPITAGTLARQGNSVKQAEYLRLFCADNIVRDCEAIRQCLTADYPEEKRKWSVLGQSFGGFCAVCYLSKFSEGLKEVFTCGGLPPMVKGPDPVYRRMYKVVEERNQAYFAKYPEDVERLKVIIKYLDQEKRALPSGGTLTSARFLQFGICFGFHGGLDLIHDMGLQMWNELEMFGSLARPTLSSIDKSFLGFDDNILYAMLHEAIYCQGRVSNWSADRIRSEFPRFDINVPGHLDKPMFTGEMMYKEMFDSFVELRELKEVANINATFEDWPDLYDEAQLAKNEVPVYAFTAMHDVYVDFSFARETASKIKNCKQFITNVMYHDAIGKKSDELIRQLFAMRDDSVD